MHDVKAIREDPESYVRGWSARGVTGSAEIVGGVLKLDAELRAVQTGLQDVHAQIHSALTGEPPAAPEAASPEPPAPEAAPKPKRKRARKAAAAPQAPEAQP